MEEKVSYFRGTSNTEQFTKKLYCITLILVKRTNICSSRTPKTGQTGLSDLRWQILFSPVNLGIVEAQHQTNSNRTGFNAI